MKRIGFAWNPYSDRAPAMLAADSAIDRNLELARGNLDVANDQLRNEHRAARDEAGRTVGQRETTCLAGRRGHHGVGVHGSAIREHARDLSVALPATSSPASRRRGVPTARS